MRILLTNIHLECPKTILLKNTFINCKDIINSCYLIGIQLHFNSWNMPEIKIGIMAFVVLIILKKSAKITCRIRSVFCHGILKFPLCLESLIKMQKQMTMLLFVLEDRLASLRMPKIKLNTFAYVIYHVKG